MRKGMMHMSRAIATTLVIGALLLSALAARAPASEEGPPRLLYRQPASEWTAALPLGNGRLGGMVFGGVAEERIALHEDTFWSGGPYDPTIGEVETILGPVMNDSGISGRPENN
jgi:alpha-L-fucosidase 2